MAHIRVATYRLEGATTFPEVADAAKSGMLDTFRLEPGFRGYEVADVGNSELISISHWESQESAERGVALAKDWVAENLGGKITLESNRVGDVAFSAD